MEPGQPAQNIISASGNSDQSIKFCEHTDELQVYSSSHNTALCNECYFENASQWGKTLTLKQASNEHVQHLEQIYKQCTDNLQKCQDMQQRILNQESLVDEITKKVDQQFDMLKGIIDEQKTNAKCIINNLESVQEYRPPPHDFTNQTLEELKSFQNDIHSRIQNLVKLNQVKKYLDVLQQKHLLSDFHFKTQDFKSKISSHCDFVQENARPVIEVKSEVDKFRGFLHDVISFEPDYILASIKPRLHYYNEESKHLLVHQLDTQTTVKIPIRNADVLPQEFTSIQAQNKIFFIGGEKKENDIRSVFSNECYVVNELTYEVQKRAFMNNARSGHQLAHLHRKFEFKTKDFIYAIGSKYPDETSKKCEVYDISKNRWIEICDLEQSRHYHTVTVLDSRYIYVIGGRDSMNETPLESIERLDGFLDLDKQKWESLQHVNQDNMWSPRDTLGSFALNDSEILIFGGDYGWISDCFNFNTKTNEIKRMGECSLKKPEEFFRAQPVRYNEKIFVVGCLDKDLHVFSIKAQKWFLLEKWYVDW